MTPPWTETVEQNLTDAQREALREAERTLGLPSGQWAGEGSLAPTFRRLAGLQLATRLTREEDLDPFPALERASLAVGYAEANTLYTWLGRRDLDTRWIARHQGPPVSSNGGASYSGSRSKDETQEPGEGNE